MMVDAASAQRVADDGEGAAGMPDLLSGEDVCGGEEDAHAALIHCDELPLTASDAGLGQQPGMRTPPTVGCACASLRSCPSASRPA